MGSNNEKPFLCAVKYTRIEKLPFAEDIEEYMPENYTKIYSESVEDYYDKDNDITFRCMDELIPLFYKKQKKDCPIEIKSFDDLLEQTIVGVDGQPHFIDSYENYFECYGIEIENIYWIRSVPVFACIETSQDAAERFILEHNNELPGSQIVPIEAGRMIPANETAQFPW